MIKYNNNTVNKFAMDSTINKIYVGGNLAYIGVKGESPTPPTPTGSTCSIIISEPITSYTSTTYDYVYSCADVKWYVLNNLNEYEEYGIYETGTSLSDFTTYEGKLTAIGTTEYQYSNGAWSVVGTYEDSSTTYEVTDDSTKYQGETLLTTFKIPMSDVESMGYVGFGIRDNNGGTLNINLHFGGGDYRYEGDDYYQGTVTDDGEYFYLSLSSEAPQSIVIESTDYWNLEPIHIIFGTKTVTVEYAEKAKPSSTVYNTVAEMEEVTCPDVAINEYAFVGNDLYKYFANEEWDGVTYFEPKMVAFYESNDPLVVYKNGNTTLEEGETKKDDVSPISVYIGDSVQSIGDNTFQYCSSLTSVTIPSGVTSIGSYAFLYCSSLTSVTIPSGVTSIGYSAFQFCSNLATIDIPDSVTNIKKQAFQYCSGLTSVTIPNSVTSIEGDTFGYCSSLTSITIPSGVTSIGIYAFAHCSGLTSVTIPSGVTSIGGYAFQYCSSLTSVTVEATTPPTLGVDALKNTNNCPIYVPSSAVETFKKASVWKNYASRIQAIP